MRSMGETPYLRENRTILVNKPHTRTALAITEVGAIARDFPVGFPSFFRPRAFPDVIRIHA